MKTSALEREISLEQLLMTAQKHQFQEEHNAFYGIYDNEGLESFLPIGNHFDLQVLNKVSDKLNSLNLRARFAGHRDAKVYICWVSKENQKSINTMLTDGEFTEASNELKTKAIFV